MIVKDEIVKMAEKHAYKQGEGFIYAECEKGESQICVTGDIVALLIMIERALNCLCELSGMSFNQIEEVIWKIRQDRKTIEKIKRGKK